jgi:hypothetical protein
MGYDLYGKDGRYCRWNITGWAGILEQAIEYGWHPAGTEPPDWEKKRAACGAAAEAFAGHWMRTLRQMKPDCTEAEARHFFSDIAAGMREDAETPLTDEDRSRLAQVRDGWDGNYDNNIGQFVTDEDANNLADALDRFLETGNMQLVFRPTHETAVVAAVQAALPQGAFKVPGQDDEDDEVRARVREFIAFCRAGGFCIT